MTHLPALQVVVPLIAAPVCMLPGARRLAWPIATLASLASMLIAFALLNQVQQGGTISYALGGWPAPFGIEYRVDLANALVLLVVSSISTIVLISAPAGIAADIPQSRTELFYTGWLLCLTGLLGMTVTGDAFNVFVFLEISSLSSYFLIALGRQRRALRAAFHYLVQGTIGATFLLIGIGLMYMMTGTLNMADLAERIDAVQDTRTIRVALAFVVIGLAIKAAIFPLHAWLPNAYGFAPNPVAAFLAGTATKVSIYILVRFVFGLFGGDFSFGNLELGDALLPIALAGALIPSLVALYQKDAKAVLAYSSVAQIGYMVLGIALASAAGLAASLLHLFNHAMMKTALFLAVGAVVLRVGSSSLDQFNGIGRRMPWTMAAFVAAGLSLIGVPPTAGFVSKWLLLEAALESGAAGIVAAIVVIASSVIAVFYVGRIVERAYFRMPAPGHANIADAPLSILLPLWVLAGAGIWFGLATDLPLETARSAAAALSGPLP
ncbi:MAG: monovalent cation/H+ antiporter subunit D family protein [Chromatiales bacterium]|nr:monovalent cation/H+ antiporter subunit D family protein [Chromatiales bacterium]